MLHSFWATLYIIRQFKNVLGAMVQTKNISDKAIRQKRLKTTVHVLWCSKHLQHLINFISWLIRYHWLLNGEVCILICSWFIYMCTCTKYASAVKIMWYTLVQYLSYNYNTCSSSNTIWFVLSSTQSNIGFTKENQTHWYNSHNLIHVYLIFGRI